MLCSKFEWWLADSHHSILNAVLLQNPFTGRAALRKVPHSAAFYSRLCCLNKIKKRTEKRGRSRVTQCVLFPSFTLNSQAKINQCAFFVFSPTQTVSSKISLLSHSQYPETDCTYFTHSKSKKPSVLYTPHELSLSFFKRLQLTSRSLLLRAFADKVCPVLSLRRPYIQEFSVLLENGSAQPAENSQ